MRRTCPSGHVYEKSTDCPACPVCARTQVAQSPLPKVGAPATRALNAAGIQTLRDVAAWSERDLLALHGVGPRAVAILRTHLAAIGLSLAE